MLLIALCKLKFYSKIIMLRKATKVLYTTFCIRNLLIAIVEKLLVLVVAEPNLVAVAFAANDRGCYRDFKSRMNVRTKK